MEIKELTIKTEKYAQKSHFTLLPFGDLQVGSPLFSRNVWERYTEAVSAAQNPITIGMGDYSDHFRPSVQERLTSAIRGYDKESLHSIQDMHREFMDKKVLPLLRSVVKGSTCLGLLAGHHDMDYNDGTNSTQYLCNQLKVPYLGRGEAIVRVNLCLSGTNEKKRLNFDIFATHGEGGGASVGGAVRKLQNLMPHFDVDVILRGHSCDRFVFAEPRYSLTRTHPPRLRCRNRVIANTGGFSESRIEKVTTYVEQSNMVPKAMGWVELHVRVKREDHAGVKKGQGTHYLDIWDK